MGRHNETEYVLLFVLIAFKSKRNIYSGSCCKNKLSADLRVKHVIIGRSNVTSEFQEIFPKIIKQRIPSFLLQHTQI
jgi:hypothetical protein